MSSNTDRGLSQEEFPRLPGQAFAEELDLPLEQEMSRDLITYNVDKEVMVMAAKVLFISQEEFMEKQLAYALARSAAVLMPKKVYLEKQEDSQLPYPVQDFSLAQVVNKLEMARVRLTHAKEVKVVDISKAAKIKVGLQLNISDS